MSTSPPELAPPLAILLELTHRCPLACPYCSNPEALVTRQQELSTQAWQSVIDQAAALGIIQAHFSGGEPALRQDLTTLVHHASAAGLYTNLITSGLALTPARLVALREAGLDHLQLSVQDSRAPAADRVAHLGGSHAKKLAIAAHIRAAGIALTLNAVIHRHNIERVGELIDLAVGIGAQRLELAHVQYHGWALRNRAALMPSAQALEQANNTVALARERLQGRMIIDYVLPDYYAVRPKACMAGWAQRFINVAPDGTVLPCHAAQTIPDMAFPNIASDTLINIWSFAEAFTRFRGTAWMPSPCRECEYRERDWGGCRCQALTLSGRADALDPVCQASPDHAHVQHTARSEAAEAPPDFVFRHLSGP